MEKIYVITTNTHSHLSLMSEFVPSVNAMVGICFFIALGYIYYILKMAHEEMADGSDDTPEQEVVLQLSLFGDKPCG